MAAQIAAGIQPIKVNCKMKQIIPENILPLKIKDKKGKRMAISIVILSCFIVVKLQIICIDAALGCKKNTLKRFASGKM